MNTWERRFVTLSASHFKGMVIVFAIGVGWCMSLSTYLVTLVVCLIWPNLWPYSSFALLLGPVVLALDSTRRTSHNRHPSNGDK